jgi:hypothetical protein
VRTELLRYVYHSIICLGVSILTFSLRRRLNHLSFEMPNFSSLLRPPILLYHHMIEMCLILDLFLRL